jgi:hypothetical protein
LTPVAGDIHNTLDENAPPEAEGSFTLAKGNSIRNIFMCNLGF